MKDGFVLYCSHYPTIQLLSIEEKGNLLDVVFKYHIYGVEPEIESFPVKIAFSFLKQQFDRNNEKYQNIVERNKLNGIKGGRPQQQNNPVGLLGTKKNPEEPRKANNDNGNDNGNGNGKKLIAEKMKTPILTETEKFISSLPDKWKPIVIKWLDFKKEKQQPYKGIMSLNTMFEQLKKFSNGNPDIGLEIIDNSISSNYSGFFELNQKQNGTDKFSNSTNKITKNANNKSIYC